MNDTLIILTQALLDAARNAGATSADAMAVQGTSVSVDVRGGGVEQAGRAEATDIGLRVFLGSRQACVSSSDTRPETLTSMAERAVAMAREAPEDPCVGLAESDQLSYERSTKALQLADTSVEPDPALLEQDARAAEAAALKLSGISQVQAASAGYGARQVCLAASNGFAGQYTRTDRYISCVAIAGEGTKMERDYDSDSRLYQADLRSADDIGHQAATRAVARLNPQKPPTGHYPVLFDERISASLLGHFLSAINGATVVRGASWLRDALEQPVLPADLSLISDPHRLRVSGSRLFDAEGLATRHRTIVENGILTGWTLDLATGRRLGMESTADAMRGTAGPPAPVAGNIMLSSHTNVASTRESLIADMGTGLIVTSLIGSTINPTTGDYSRGASGFWVENGQITGPVNECTIAGNLRDMLQRIIPANDARMHLSHVVPSLLIGGMAIAGQ